MLPGSSEKVSAVGPANPPLTFGPSGGVRRRALPAAAPLEARMRFTLLTKITGLVFIAVLLVGGGNYLASRHFLTASLDDQNIKEVITRADLVSDEFEQLKKNLTGYAYLMANNPQVANHIADGDTAWLQDYARKIMEQTGIESITISDKNGVCVARGHSPKVGDSVAKQVNVQKALKGEVTVGVEQGTVVKFSLRTGCPVRKGDEIVGVVTPGFTLSSDRFVDQIKKNLGLECTLFQGDTRISTTIVKEGKRAVGTKMDNPAVLDAVLAQGKRFTGHNVILGRAYNTAYWPIVDVNGKNAGMFFIGQPREFIERVLSETHLSTLVSTIVVGLVMLIGGFLFSKMLVKPIVQSIDFADQVAKGNLDGEIHVTSNDETHTLAESLRTMSANLKVKIQEAEASTRAADAKAREAEAATQEALEAKAMAENAKREGMLDAAGKLEEIVERITSSSEELSAQVELMSRGVELQRDRVAETASAMEQMNASVISVARQAGEVSTSAETAKTKASGGSEVVRRSQQAIGNVNEIAVQLKANMEQLGAQAEAIGQVMNVINDIADQTNLLALNAAIEAARAGDAGRGFAVVADEVRKLAEKTMGATKEVGSNIRAIQESSRKNIDSMDNVGQAIAEATSHSDESAKALDEIVVISSSNAARVQSIAGAAEEQSGVSEKISAAIEEVNRVASENAEGMSQSVSAIGELARMAAELRQLIGELKES
jgi:methyl-accepting chemotaxis protein